MAFFFARFSIISDIFRPGNMSTHIQQIMPNNVSAKSMTFMMMTMKGLRPCIECAAPLNSCCHTYILYTLCGLRWPCQQSNKPTSQQFIRAEINPPPIKSETKKKQQEIKKESTKIVPESVLKAILGALSGFLGLLGTILAPRTPQEPKNHRK